MKTAVVGNALTRMQCRQNDNATKYVIVPIRWDGITELNEFFQVLPGYVARLCRIARNLFWRMPLLLCPALVELACWRIQR